ncbi:MAG: hypothetical protein AAAFM81_11430 [Pseudomonadota bacterium]
MNDTTATFIAACIELGIPLVAVVCLFRSKSAARIALSVLGGVTPFLCFYLACAIEFWINDGDDGSFTFYAMWQMSFVPYMIVVGLSLLISRWSWPTSAVARFTISLIGPIIGLALLLGLESGWNWLTR